MARIALLGLTVTLLAGATASAQDAPSVAIVPVPGDGIGPELGQPLLEAVRGALTTAAPSARFAIRAEPELMTGFGTCSDAECRRALVLRSTGYAVVLVHMARPTADGAVQLRVQALATSGEPLGAPAEIQLPPATAANPEAARAVLATVLGSVASAIPAAPPLPPVSARLLVAVNADGADVLVDGESVGRSPLSALEVEPGTHTLVIRTAGFETYSRSIEVPAGGLRVDAFLEPTGNQAEELARRDAEEAAAYGSAEDDGLVHRWWFWAAVGGGAVVMTALIVAIALAAGNGEGGGVQEGFPIPPLPESM